MASLSVIEAKINALPSEIRVPMLEIFRELLGHLRFGHPSTVDEAEPLTNFDGAFVHTTTPSNAGDVFTIPHGLGRTPYLGWPVLLLDTVGSTNGVFTVQRAADDDRIYLTSTLEDAPVSFVVEG